MKERLLAIFLILVVLTPAWTYSEGEKAKASYALSYGSKLTGTIEVDLKTNEVIVRSERSIVNLTCMQVQEVLVQNVTTGEMELYHSGTFGLNDKPVFFQVLYNGPISLLYREGMVFSAYEEERYPPYFVQKDGRIYSLGTKKDLLKLFGSEKSKDINAFFKACKINIQDRNDLICLFDYYNRL